MTESVSEVSNVDTNGDDLMPFRLRDMKLKFNASNIHPIFDPIDEVRKQIKFITLLAYTELTKNRSIMLAFGILGFFLGSVKWQRHKRRRLDNFGYGRIDGSW